MSERNQIKNEDASEASIRVLQNSALLRGIKALIQVPKTFMDELHTRTLSKMNKESVH